jgi:hypothetical protein
MIKCHYFNHGAGCRCLGTPTRFIIDGDEYLVSCDKHWWIAQQVYEKFQVTKEEFEAYLEVVQVMES